MKTHFEFMYFIKSKDDPSNTSWRCFSQKDHSFVGRIEFCTKIKEHFFVSENAFAFPFASLNDITSFIAILNNQ